MIVFATTRHEDFICRARSGNRRTRESSAFLRNAWIRQENDAAATLPQRVDIKGHAVDHAAVTAFTRALREQPSVQDVRLVDTGLRRYSTTQVVDFTLAATRVAASGAQR